jgi:hypothetical protein
MASSATLTDASIELETAADTAVLGTLEKADQDVETAGFPEWHSDPENPLNWTTWRKTTLVVIISLQALTA